MKLETERITSFQFMFTVACFLQSSALLSAFFAPITQQDSWLVVLFGMVCSTPILLVYCAIMKNFPGQNLIQITLAALGKPAGTLVSLIFIWFFLTLSALNLRDFGQFVRQIILVETPSIAVVAVCITLVAYTVLKGVKVVTRYLNRMEILFAIVLVVLLFFKICCLFYVSVLAIAQLFNLKSYHPLVLMLGALIVGYSFFVFPTSTVHSAYSRETAPILWLLFEFLLPLLVLIVGRARGFHKQQIANE